MRTKKSKMTHRGFHWGWGITLAIILGASGLIFLVIKSSQVSYDMVMDNYYEEEMDYEQMIQAQYRFEMLSADFEVLQSDQWVILQFPEEMLTKELKEAHLEMYRPSGKNEDLVIPFELDEQARIVLKKSDLNVGAYIVKGNWYMDGERYNLNKGVLIQK